MQVRVLLHILLATTNPLALLASQPPALLEQPLTIDISASPPAPPIKKARARANRANAQSVKPVPIVPVIPLNGSKAAPLVSMIEWQKELLSARADKLSAEAEREAAVQAAKAELGATIQAANAKAKVVIEQAEQRESVAMDRYLELVGLLAFDSGTLPAPPAPPAQPVAGPSRTRSKGKGKGKARAEPSDDEDGGMAEKDVEGSEGFMDTTA
jgi:hypothetical protein